MAIRVARVVVKCTLSAVLLSSLAQPPLSAQTAVQRRAVAPAAQSLGPPVEIEITRTGTSVRDLRTLPRTRPVRAERPEREPPPPPRIELPGAPQVVAPIESPVTKAAAPAPLASYPGLDFATWGAGHPPDTVGDVGPTYYIQSINSSVGIFRKSDGFLEAAFTFNTFMSQGTFGNLCDTNNFGDPVILYDSFEDRWVLSDFAFELVGGAVANPPGAFQCFAVSKTGDPLTGGWNFYALHITDALNDYPKLGIWTDGIYMSANMFGFPAGGSFMGSRVWALDKAQMYAGEPTVQVVTFNAPAADFTLLPSNARLQTGTPPPGAPNYFVSTWQFLNGLTVYKLHVDWDSISLSTFTGPDVPLAATSWPNAAVANAPSQGGNSLDVLQIRAMMQNQYTNLGGVESLWLPHTVRRANTTGFAAPRWYQVDVTGGTVAAALPQAATWDPDGANVLHRFMPSLAVDRAGDMALGYTTSSSTTKPAIQYAGRLAGDPLNTFSQTEQLLHQGAGTQTGLCGGSTCTRWGDYSAMALDPDGCTFWYTNMFYAADGLDHQTRWGSFAFPSCTPVGAGGTLSGTVTATAGGAPIAGATLTFGSRTTTTDGSGFYSFAAVPAGSYPSETASAPGYDPATTTNIVIADGATTTRDFSLDTAPTTACLTDTTQPSFQRGVPTAIDLVTTPGDALLTRPDNLDQLNESVTTSGFGVNSTSWAAQTFTAGLSGQLTKADLDLFCSGCTGTTPNITVSIRATTGSPAVPIGADLATATIAGFNSGAGGYFTATFGTPATVTAGTRYALVIRAVSNPSAGTYAYVCSCTSPNSNPYLDGQRVTSANSGSTWTADTTSGGRDLGFHVYVNSGYTPAGTLVSSLKDSNPPSGQYPMWTTLSWTDSTPAGTDVRFQVAASDQHFGPFDFVGPDGTAATFFTTSGASLSQFDGFRYLKYEAYLATTDGTVTPVVNDVTVCFEVVAADVSITKTDGVTTAVPGGSVVYTIDASNPGPAAATGVSVSDTFPATLTCTWTCNGAGGGTCTASGSGNIADTVNLPAGASVIYTATCAIAASATGMLSNTATVSSADDPTAGNDSATDTDTLTPAADLSITKTDGVAAANAGGSVTYTITAANAGPSDAPGASVNDTFPASLTCTWTCSGAGGGTCTASGSDELADTVNLPAGASVTYTADCSVASDASGSIVNTVTVAPPAGVTDPNAANDSATDTDTLTAPSGSVVTATKTVSGDPEPGATVVYTIELSNAAPAAQPDNPGDELVDLLPADLVLTAATATSGTVIANTAVTWNGSIPAGGSVTIMFEATIVASAGQTVSNQGTVAYDADGNGTNESSAATDDPGAPGGADATTFVVAAPLVIEIPTLSLVGLLILGLLLAGVAFGVLRPGGVG